VQDGIDLPPEIVPLVELQLPARETVLQLQVLAIHTLSGYLPGKPVLVKEELLYISFFTALLNYGFTKH
jgi:hypothetical protein